MLIAFNKPYGVISQFSSDGSKNRTLAEFGFPKDVYPVGRLDADSEGLLLLSDEKSLVTELLEPSRGHPREYWVEVEGVPDTDALEQLARGVDIKGYRTRPCRAWAMEPPAVWPRDPPVRFRKTVPTSWIALELVEGKNRQVRRMTAQVGFPTLRLIRARIGAFLLEDLEVGTFRELGPKDRDLVFAGAARVSAARGNPPRRNRR